MTHTMPARALPGRDRTCCRRAAGRGLRRKVWSRRLAPALAACALSVDAAGQQDFDVRPIYYAMLAAVESSFTAHSEKIEETYRTSREALERSATRDLRHLETEGEEIERARRDRAAVFEAERAALNARIEAVNEAVGRIETDREGSAAAIESYREAYVRVLDELQAARSRHRALIAVVQARREALENLAHAYREGTSEDAQEVARLDNAYRRFVAQVLDAFGGREAALRLERESLRTWLHDQLARLERSEGELVPLTERLAALEDDHDRVQGELNRRIDVYNEHVRAARENDTQGDELTALRVGIAEYRELLDEHRTRAATLVREYRNRHAALRAEHEAFEGERMERREALRLRTETLVSERRDIADLVESRRTDVQAQIELIEDRVRASLSALRAEAGICAKPVPGGVRVRSLGLARRGDAVDADPGPVSPLRIEWGGPIRTFATAQRSSLRCGRCGARPGR